MPKSLLSLVLALTLSLSFIPSASAQDLTALSNADILTMVRAKLPSTLIVEKINTSNCNFDTFPSVLAELKHKGVGDEVLMAMVQAPHGSPLKLIKEIERPAEVKPSNNIAGVILRDRSETPFNARFFVAQMDEGFDGLIAALMLEKKLPLTVVAEEGLADFIVIGGTNKGPHKWYDTVFGGGYERDRNQGSIRVIRVRDKTVIWAAQKGDRSIWWGSLKKGGRRKVAERLVNKMKDDLFDSGF